jgi:tetratricopeptide (TPR) repeat protein
MMEAASPAQAVMRMGKASYETENFEEAAGYFRKAMEAGTLSGDAHRGLGKTLISLRNNDAAGQELRLADPEDSEALYFLGGILAQENRPEAVMVPEKARGLNPDFWGSAIRGNSCLITEMCGRRLQTLGKPRSRRPMSLPCSIS